MHVSSFSRTSTHLTQQGGSSGGFLADSSAFWVDLLTAVSHALEPLQRRGQDCMMTSSDKSHSSTKLGFCGTVWTGLLCNLATSSYSRHEGGKLPPHQWVGENYMAISGTSLQIKLQLIFSGVKRWGFAGTVSAMGLQQDKKCAYDGHLSHKSVTVKWFHPHISYEVSIRAYCAWKQAI